MVDGDLAVEQKVTLRRAEAVAAASSGGGAIGYGFLAILGLAILGGLILNLMPCVLPVLSIKLLSVVGHGGEAPSRVRAGFLASAAGIVAVSCFSARSLWRPKAPAWRPGGASSFSNRRSSLSWSQ